MTLAEAIERVAAKVEHYDACNITREEYTTLLSAARRVQAMEAVGGAVARVRALLAAEEAAEEENDGDLQAAVDRTQMEFPELLPVILDLASDRDVQAAEVERLREELERAAEQVDAWKDASGLECGGDPDGVTPAAMKRYWESVESRADQAEARVRETQRLLDKLIVMTASGADLLGRDKQKFKKLCREAEALGPIPEATR